VVSLPRLVIAAPSTGQGKTTIATGLMAALRAAGHEVSGHKVGPDFVDPGYHALATGRPGRNLDPHLVGEERIVPLLLHGAANHGAASHGAGGHGAGGAGIAVIEGVMGLYDGRLGTDGFASTAHVAALTVTPVVLVLDVARLSRTAAAIAAGLAGFDPAVRVAGVVLNRAGSVRNDAEITRALARVGLPVFGTLPHDEALSVPSRHLGLVPAAERDGSAAMIARLGEQVARHIDLDALLDVARQAPDLDASPWDPHHEVRPPGRDRVPPGSPRGPDSPAAAREPGLVRPVVAMAGGRAFTFRYAETEELLQAAGCDVITFDPLTDAALPAGTAGIYLGGGFPEMHAAELAANRSLLDDLRAAVAAGTPTVGECAGLLYLTRSLDKAPMTAAIPADAAMTGRLTLRYPEATAACDSLLTRSGERVTGHEFHRTQTAPVAGLRPAWEIEGNPSGFTTATLHAAYLHVHWAGHPRLAQRFADAVHAAVPHRPGPHAARPQVTVPQSAGSPAAGLHTARPCASPTRHARTPSAAVPDEALEGDPLRHHGDTEASAGYLDFAVNVFAGDRPAWLDRALHAAVDASAAYPDAAPACAAIARHHGRSRGEVLATAGAAEAFTLIARLRPWRMPVVVHPQFTEPHAALAQAGHAVTTVTCQAGDNFALDPAAVPAAADLVIIGNPVNPTGILHPAALLRRLRRPGRLVVIDEAFMDAVPDQAESLARDADDGLLVIRSLTKHWSIPGIRAGYVLGRGPVIAELAAIQTPWSVSTAAIAAAVACATAAATAEARRRALALGQWRDYLQAGLNDRSVAYVPSSAPFVLARLGAGTRGALRARGVAVRRCDTFPGLDASWARIAVRPPTLTDHLLLALDQIRPAQPHPARPSSPAAWA
jgi:cobyrinic acid a,c-diamide synthase